MSDRMRKNSLRILNLLLLGGFVLLLSACYAPQAQIDGGLEFNISMAPGDADTRVLAGLVVDAGFEQQMKELTQLLAVLSYDSLSPEVEDQIDETATEYLLDLAFDAVISFGGNPFFTVEVPYDADNNTADFNLYGIPSGRDYFLYMGGFQDTDEVKQYFGLKDEDSDFDGDLIPYSNLFYVSGTEDGNNNITVPFAVSGVSNPIPGGFVIGAAGQYSGPGWYFLEHWDFETTLPTPQTTIIAPAGQPFEVETGKKSVVDVVLVVDYSGIPLPPPAE